MSTVGAAVPVTSKAAATISRPARDPSIDYLRAFVTVLVLLTHSGLAYSNLQRAAPRWFEGVPLHDLGSPPSLIFDYLFGFADVCLMALMFFVSALFAHPALRRYGVPRFLADRARRLMIPFFAAVVVIMPIAYYAAWQLENPSGSFLTFWVYLAHAHFGASGPAWFLWILLVLDCLLAAVFLLFKSGLASLAPGLEKLAEQPVAVAALMFAVCAVLYLPLFAYYGYGYGSWKIIVHPFMFQPSRFGVYLAWTIAGFLVGITGLERGLIARSGSLVRHWAWWTAAAVTSYSALWMLPRLTVFPGLPAGVRHWSIGLLWVLTNVVCVLGGVAFFRARVHRRRPLLDSLTRVAYAVYLVHYIFVLWSQRVLLGVQMSVVAKGMLSFVFTLAASWLVGLVLVRTPGIRRIV